jgi:tetratricopeptide (TPR) repeat protein
MSVPDLRFVASLIDQGQTAKARGLLEKMIALMPTRVAPYVLLARLAELDDRDDEALQIWQDAVALTPTSPAIRDGLDRVLRKLHLRTVSIDLPAELPEFEDLDSLIEELESARIVPDPDVRSIPTEELESEIEDVVSETLARIYAAQRYFQEASRVYEKLASQDPDRKDEFALKAEQMQKRAAGLD